MKVIVRSILDRIRFLVRTRSALWIAFVGLVLALLPYVPRWPKWASLLIGLAGLALAAWSMFWEAWVQARVSRDYRLVERNPVFQVLPKVASPTSQVIETTRGHMVHDPVVDARLSGGWTARWDPRKYELPEKLREVAPYVLDKTTSGHWNFNGLCVRLSSDLNGSSSQDVWFQPASFFDHLCSNELMRWEVAPKGESWDIRHEFFLDREDQLNSVSNSRLANIVGCSTLAITTDDKVLVVGQTTGNHSSGGLLAPSGSGSLEPMDVHDGWGLEEVVLNGAVRELVEETGLDLTQVAGSRLTMFGRWLEKGGKPEFFCITALTVDARTADVHRRATKSEEKLYVADVEWLDLAGINQHEAVATRSSLPLTAALAALDQALAAEPGLLDKLRASRNPVM